MNLPTLIMLRRVRAKVLKVIVKSGAGLCLRRIGVFALGHGTGDVRVGALLTELRILHLVHSRLSDCAHF